MSIEKSLTVPGVTHAQLTEFAYITACCLQDGAQAEVLLRTLESQLDITSSQARMLQHMAKTAGMMPFPSASNKCPNLAEFMGDPAKVGYVAMLLWTKLLPEMPNQKFPSHADFNTSCTSAAGTIAGIASHLSANSCSACKVSVSADEASRMMAALRGHTRRLSEPEEQFFHKQEFQACSSDIDSTVGKLVDALKQSGNRETDLALCLSLILLGAQYDDLSDTGYVDNRDEVIAVIEGQILSKLGVQARHMSLLNAWVRCDQFLVSRETSHLRALQDVLRAKSGGGAADSSELSLADHAHSCRLTKKLHVRSGIGGKLDALCHDSFKSLSAAQLPVVLDIVRMCATTQRDMNELLHEAVSSSTERELCRVWSEELDSIQSAHVAVLDTAQLRSRLDAAKALIEARSPYVKQLDAELGPTEPCFATMVRRCHRCVGRYFCAWRDSGADVLGKHANVVQEAAFLELYMLDKLKDCGTSALPEQDNVPANQTSSLLQLWASAEALQPLQFTWLEGRNAEIHEFTSRLLQSETWKQAASSMQHFPETPIELQRLCAAAVSAILEMNVPTSGTIIRTQLEVVCGLVLRFCQSVLRGCEDPSKLVRPSPPLTRFKDKLFQKVLVGVAVKSGMSKLEKKDPEYLLAIEEYKRQLAKREELSLENLLLRLNSVCHAAHALARLIERTKGEYKDVVARYKMDEQRELGALEGCTGPAEQALSEAERTLQEFLANSAVFVDMSEIWYDKLYKTEVKGSTADDVGALSRLDELLSKIMDMSLPQTAEFTAEVFAKTAFSALRHTLLHGGEFRYYALQDADLLQADLSAFKALFHADGHGVAVETLGKGAAPVQDVIDSMSIPTNILAEAMDGLLGVKHAKPIGTIPKSCQNVETLKCILSHRRDRAASKYLKDRVKMPKMDGKRRGILF